MSSIVLLRVCLLVHKWQTVLARSRSCHVFQMAPEGMIGKLVCASHKQPHATIVTWSWSDTAHIPYSTVTINAACCIRLLGTRCPCRGEGGGRPPDRGPGRGGAEPPRESEYGICSTLWLNRVCVAQMQTVSDRDVHDQEVETLGRKLIEAEREAAAANVCFGPWLGQPQPCSFI